IVARLRRRIGEAEGDLAGPLTRPLGALAVPRVRLGRRDLDQEVSLEVPVALAPLSRIRRVDAGEVVEEIGHPDRTLEVPLFRSSPGDALQRESLAREVLVAQRYLDGTLRDASHDVAVFPLERPDDLPQGEPVGEGCGGLLERLECLIAIADLGLHPRDLP